MNVQSVSGSEALAYGALDAGVRFATGYPGSPSTATIEALLHIGPDQARVEWAINEKSAFDAAFGASLANIPSLLCLKSVGLNVALDSLMVSNLAGPPGGFVILVGDDPGGWGSQNEEDSRLLAAAAEVPLLEPTTTAEARALMRHAFDLSRQFQLPVLVRITRALALDRTPLDNSQVCVADPEPARFQRQPERFNVLPIHVVEFHERLQATLAQIEPVFEDSAFNRQQGQGRLGVLVAGFARQKLDQILTGTTDLGLQMLHLSTLYPLPRNLITRFLQQVDALLVIEETAPYLETLVQAMAQRAGLTLPILGRFSGHLPGAGELFAPQLAQALASLWPDWQRPALAAPNRTMPSRQPLCDGCPYIPAFDSLLAVMQRHGGRDAFVVTGETGCMVRGQLPPWEMLDVKYGMGSSIGLAAGMARAHLPQKIVALSGDSAFLHSGLGELIDAAQAGVEMLVVVLANQTTALSGGQPHPATAHDAHGQPRQGIDLEALIHACGVKTVQAVDPEDTAATQAALEAGLACEQLSVVIVQRACPVWAGKSQAFAPGVDNS
jgi:indolepyruvate ferredoxin oxidoreductase alpha subunit